MVNGEFLQIVGFQFFAKIFHSPFVNARFVNFLKVDKSSRAKRAAERKPNRSERPIRLCPPTTLPYLETLVIPEGTFCFLLISFAFLLKKLEKTKGKRQKRKGSLRATVQT
jgi:hypothetical protein